MLEKKEQDKKADSERIRTSRPEVVENHPDDELRPTADSGKVDHHPGPHGEASHAPSRANPALLFQQLQPKPNARADSSGDAVAGTTSVGSSTLAQCDTPINLDAKDQPISIDTQIQLYATNAQICHPWVSPVLGYMGGLPPLFICAGANEVLRDEIIYL